MNNTATDADVDAFGRPLAASGRASASMRGAPRRRVWPWLLLSLLVLAVVFVASVVAGVLVLGDALEHALGGFDVRIDGERVFSLPKGEAAWWAVAAAVLAAMVMLVVVPLSLLLALLIAVLALAALVIVALALGAIALSPLWVIALLLWFALREPRSRKPGSALRGSATP